MHDKGSTDIRGLEAVAYAQSGYFTSEQARTHGVSRQLLNHHVRQGRFEQIRRGLYRVRGFPSSQHDEVREKWMAVGAEKAIVSHESALALHGLSDVLPNTVHLLVSREHRGVRAPSGVTLHTATSPIPESDITTRHGIRVTTPARTIIDAARSGTAPEQIQMAIRQALQEGRTTADTSPHS
jgi:predicted transcriptional regulator of viral defense system